MRRHPPGVLAFGIALFVVATGTGCGAASSAGGPSPSSRVRTYADFCQYLPADQLGAIVGYTMQVTTSKGGDGCIYQSRTGGPNEIVCDLDAVPSGADQQFSQSESHFESVAGGDPQDYHDYTSDTLHLGQHDFYVTSTGFDLNGNEFSTFYYGLLKDSIYLYGDCGNFPGAGAKRTMATRIEMIYAGQTAGMRQNSQA